MTLKAQLFSLDRGSVINQEESSWSVTASSPIASKEKSST